METNKSSQMYFVVAITFLVFGLSGLSSIIFDESFLFAWGSSFHGWLLILITLLFFLSSFFSYLMYREAKEKADLNE